MIRLKKLKKDTEMIMKRKIKFVDRQSDNRL